MKFNKGDKVRITDKTTLKEMIGNEFIIDEVFPANDDIYDYAHPVYELENECHWWAEDELELVAPFKQRGFEVCKGFTPNLPKRATKNSAGYDFECYQDTLIPHGEVRLVPTGVKSYMLPDEYLGLHIRSSLALKHNLSLGNDVAVIDSDFYSNPDNDGHIQFIIHNHGFESVLLTKGQRIGQGIFHKYLIVDNDDADGERVSGFGSTGK